MDGLSTASPESTDPGLPLAVGDAVVYAAHGVGHVVALERKAIAGAERDCVLVDLAAGLRVTLPVDTAAKRLRPLVTESQIATVQHILGGRASGRVDQWTKRIKESTAKLASGLPAELAEVVRDGAPLDRGPVTGVPRLSPGERRVYLQARRLLARELSSVHGIEEAEADAWIEAQLALPDESEDRCQPRRTARRSRSSSASKP